MERAVQQTKEIEHRLADGFPDSRQGFGLESVSI